MGILAILQTVGSLLTGLGAAFVFLQFRQQNMQFVTEFEDGLTKEYREIVQDLPVKVRASEDVDWEQNKQDIYRYIDLCNEQIFLRQNGRVSKETWKSWQEGMESNIQEGVFNSGWENIKSNTDSFDELKRVEKEDWDTDPYHWENIRYGEKLWRWIMGRRRKRPF
ncbi:hypothetical protein [Haloarcula argentinensis]|uniref:Uncharacterized protein n=1 Tax=Haloarcula argentinensis TaxID=43776 RepID=A0ABU2F0T7_HALAR|nr:hypothetical protein [Haloarcula argentinensis]EMA18598.1 hypothetical protein C443_18919 [Haloarcula argentinensis DSM 12282]MDS0253838.1 hypothetical protein [Haloarcula argentinensis]